MAKIKNSSVVKQIIRAYPEMKRKVDEQTPHLEIAEFFRRTVQGEGVNIGYPAAFLRMQHCTQSCAWCDTSEVWRQGNPYTFDEVLSLIESSELLQDFHRGDHLVLTGGSPVRQQKALTQFFKLFHHRFGFLPVLEVENECTLMPDPEFVKIIKVWNNSPKLSNSGNPDALRYQPKVLRFLSGLENSWFKFVVSEPADWYEIEKDFLAHNLIQRQQIIIMPMGGDIDELQENRVWAAELAIQEGVRFTDRLHVTLWNTLTGV